MPAIDLGNDAARLFERSEELASVADAIAAADAGDGLLVALEGPAGIGKTRLLEATRRAALGQGMRVLTARGGELERDFAYGVVRQLFERTIATADPATRAALLAGPAAHAARALEIDDGAQPGHPAEDRAFAVRHGLYWLVANIAADGPVLVAVDDVQWADAASLRFLAYLARRLDGVPLLAAITARSGDPTTDEHLLRAVIDDPAARRVTPKPLSATATRALLGSGHPDTVDEGFVDACHRATGGNPFLLHELRSTLARDGIAHVAENAHRVAGLGPSTVARSLVLRLARVSADAVIFARAVSVLGATTDLGHAGALAGLSPERAGEACDRLARAGVLAPDRPLRFAHPIMRDAVYHDLAPSEREALRTRAADRLLAGGAPPSEVAAHLLAIPAQGEVRIVQPLRDAARVALGQGAADLAARYLRRALEEPLSPEDRPMVLADLGRATWLAGDDPVGAVDLLRDALAETTDEAERPALAIALARAVFSTGDALGAGRVIADELARAVDRPREATLTLEAEYGSIQLLYNGGAEVGEHIMSFAELPGDTAAEMLVLTNVATWLWVGGTADEAAAVAARSLGGGRRRLDRRPPGGLGPQLRRAARSRGGDARRDARRCARDRLRVRAHRVEHDERSRRLPSRGRPAGRGRGPQRDGGPWRAALRASDPARDAVPRAHGAGRPR